MKITSEKLIERKLYELVKIHKGLCIKLLCNQMIGLPDRLCLLPGKKIAFAELKTTGQKPRPIQIAVHNKLRALGFKVAVLDSLEGVIDFIENLEKDGTNGK